MSVCTKCDRDYYSYNDVGDGICPTCADIEENNKWVENLQAEIDWEPLREFVGQLKE
jgi:hypothetical protein